MFELNVRKFRAVHDAHIVLPGITVIAGENGCGKSTISRLLYYTLDTATRFEKFVRREVEPVSKENFRRAVDLVFNLLFQIPQIQHERRKLFPGDGMPRPQDWLAAVRETFVQYASAFSASPHAVEQFLEMAKRSFLFDGKQNVWRSPIEVIDFLIRLFDDTDTKIRENIYSRPVDVLSRRLKRVFEEDVPLSAVDFLIEGASLVHNESDRLNAPIGIHGVYYIDTPWVTDLGDSMGGVARRNDRRLEHRTHLAETLLACGRDDEVLEPDAIPVSGVIHGHSATERTKTGTQLKFSSHDFGQSFNLFHCATGIKAFSVLQLLLSSGKLDKETMLILDEPESNLHPQWEVEYARIVVLLNKVLGVRFLISSHSPDFVEAIQAIAQKEGIRENVCFYLADWNASEKGFYYRPLDFDIGLIFDSFNVSMERIARYGSEV